MKNLFKTNKIELTGMTKKINIKGKIKVYPVYKIALTELYYNNQNDRIATQICEYKDKINKDVFSVDYENIEEYNEIVAEFIKESNKEAFLKTMNNIKRFSQLEAGVVTTDGRIIDGNRRFTCLRELSKNNHDFNYFNAVILDENEYTPKDIKQLELQIQHGHEDKVGYDIIDRCVGIYNDVLKDGHMFTKEEYCRYTDMKMIELNKLIEKTNLINEFLEYMGAKEKFHVAKKLEIDGPISELLSVKKNSSDWEKLKIITFDNIILKTDKDITRYIRDLKKYTKENLDEYLDEHKKTSKELHEKLDNLEEITAENIINEIRNDQDLKKRAKKVYDKYTDKGKIKEVRNQPVKLLEKVVILLDEVDEDHINRMEQEEKEAYIENIELIQKKLNEIKKLYKK